MTRIGSFAAFALLLSVAHAADKPADTVYRNGYVYTVDARDSVQQALAVRGGRIVYVGDNDGAKALTGKKTEVIDLQARMLMPGLIDGHMHPQSGGSRLLNCSLNYESLTVPQFQSRIQACLDRDKKSGADRWLVVVNWFQQGMLPDGVETTAAMLDALKTDRPIIVRSSFGHSSLLNSKGVKVAKVERDTPDPAGGKITRDDKGNVTGLLEDAAQDMAMNLLPPLTVAENLAASKAALAAMRQQGITSFLDAYTDPETMTAFTDLQKQGKLTARAHFAVLIDLDKGATPQSAVAELLKQQKQFDQGPTRVAPSMQVRHAKLFMDGVISAPAFTGAMLEPYLVNKGTPEKPDWQPGANTGPASYFSQDALRTTLKELAHAHIDPHIHVDGDRAVRESLDAIEALRATPEGKRVRPALAHDEIVDPADYPRFAQLDVTPVLSFQWAKPAPDTLGALKDYMGPQRYATVEPQVLLLNAGARIAYGSDWPVDPLDEWFALKVGVTRTAAPDAGKEYAGRLTAQPGMPRAEVLRAITLNAAYTLRQETQTGSLEVGKLADMIVLDRNFFTIPAEDIANIKVLQTVVGGKIVYQSKGMR
ncbi:amidohydrolase family protein [Pseudoduganella sp. FT25W]|uniref:Amidohydrolase family protein n=1 Tax=Duganella alba TaxID=2666081 RepID=A0A6L5QGM0_9BURK|nr:amidohydrolase [Duganella alba]MRX08432.1 amidohydrolase family protein [Duganella alba]MRX17094.1 amidohydrolase family protein [Duganella alba]